MAASTMKAGVFGVVDLGEDDEEIGEASVRDPLLGAVEDVVFAVGRERGAGLDATWRPSRRPAR